MPKVKFSFRFIIDRHFFDDAIKNENNRSKIFQDLMYISSYSAEFNREHNLMSEKIRNDIISKNPKVGEEYIKKAFNKVNEPSSIECIEDELTRNIKYAIYYVNPSPEKITQICILTSDEMKDKYLESEHLGGIQNVIVKSGDEAFELLEKFKNLAWSR